MGRMVSEGQSVVVSVPQSTTIVAGNFYDLDGFLGFAFDSVETGVGETGAVALGMDLAEFETSQILASDAFAKGDDVFWDDDNNRFTTQAGSDAAVPATLTTALAGANNDLVFTARQAGDEGNGIEVVYVDPGGNNAAESVEVEGLTLIVNLATDGAGAITSTGDSIKATIAADPAANNLVSVADAAANDGSGVVTAMAATNLAGGEDSSDQSSDYRRFGKVTVAKDDNNVVWVKRTHLE